MWILLCFGQRYATPNVLVKLIYLIAHGLEKLIFGQGGASILIQINRFHELLELDVFLRVIVHDKLCAAVFVPLAQVFR